MSKTLLRSVFKLFKFGRLDTLESSFPWGLLHFIFIPFLQCEVLLCVNNEKFLSLGFPAFSFHSLTSRWSLAPCKLLTVETSVASVGGRGRRELRRGGSPCLLPSWIDSSFLFTRCHSLGFRFWYAFLIYSLPSRCWPCPLCPRIFTNGRFLELHLVNGHGPTEVEELKPVVLPYHQFLEKKRASDLYKMFHKEKMTKGQLSDVN